MLIQVDSREQKNKEVIEYFDSIAQEYFISKMYACDYCDYFSVYKILIDLKKDMLEVCQNLTKGHERFKREILRATKELNSKMYVLIREPLKGLEDVKNWESPKNRNGKPRTQIKGETLYKTMKTISEKYDVVWEFCDRKNAGEKILNILKGGI